MSLFMYMLSDMHLHEYVFFIYYNSEKNPWGNKKWLNPHCSLLLQSADHHFRQWSWLLICKICCLCYRSQSKVLITAHFRDHCKTGVYISQYIDIRMLYSLISVLAPKKKILVQLNFKEFTYTKCLSLVLLNNTCGHCTWKLFLCQLLHIVY